MPEDDIIDWLAQHEEAIGRLYQTLAGQLPAMKTFWETIAGEERAHAEVLRMLRRRLATGSVAVSPRHFDVAAVKTAIGYIERQIACTQPESVTAIKAVATALDIEQEILERKFFDVLAPGTESMREEFQQLQRHTQEHVQRLRQRMDALRASAAG